MVYNSVKYVQIGKIGHVMVFLLIIMEKFTTTCSFMALLVIHLT